MSSPRHPNVVFVFADQWRAQATGFAGHPDVRTPNLDRFADRSVRFTNAVSNCPVCSPWRATLMTGQYPLTHGVFVNDVPIRGEPRYLAECFREAGYDTAYIGKWHIDGHGRSAHIPQERRKGFAYWKARECTHDYNESFYYGDGAERLWWEGYDAVAQTRDAISSIREHAAGERPFLLLLSWGPPHDPYGTAPAEYRRLYEPGRITLRPNVPADLAARAREWCAGYYAHCTALDACFGAVVAALQEEGIDDDTILVFTSDHGDLLGSHGVKDKQRPWDESILAPLLLRWPELPDSAGRVVTSPISAPDLMPTLLGLAGLPVPSTVEGIDHAPLLRRDTPAPRTSALIELPACFHQFAYWNGGRDWRGLRTDRHTYVIDHDGPWLLYDNERDPYQLSNLVGDPASAGLLDRLDRELRGTLEARSDPFRRGQELIAEAGYRTDARGDPVYEA